MTENDDESQRVIGRIDAHKDVRVAAVLDELGRGESGSIAHERWMRATRQVRSADRFGGVALSSSIERRPSMTSRAVLLNRRL